MHTHTAKRAKILTGNYVCIFSKVNGFETLVIKVYNGCTLHAEQEMLCEDYKARITEQQN